MTLYELQIKLTELWPNYELQVGWKFEKIGASYYANWRPELKSGLTADWIIEVCETPEKPKGQSIIFSELVERATIWKTEYDGAN